MLELIILVPHWWHSNSLVFRREATITRIADFLRLSHTSPTILMPATKGQLLAHRGFTGRVIAAVSLPIIGETV